MATNPNDVLAMLSPQLRLLRARAHAYRAECTRRGVRFLPSQVMRRIFQQSGLSDGPILNRLTALALDARLSRWQQWSEKF